MTILISRMLHARRWLCVAVASATLATACGGPEDLAEDVAAAPTITDDDGEALEANLVLADDGRFADATTERVVAAAVAASGQCSGGVPGWRQPSTWSFVVTRVDRGLVKVKVTITQPRGQPNYSDWRVQIDQRALSGASRTIYRNLVHPTGSPLTLTKGPNRVSLAAGPNTFAFTANTTRESCGGSVVF